MRPPARWSALALLLIPAAATRPDEPPRPPSFAGDWPRVETGKPVLAYNGKDLTGYYA